MDRDNLIKLAERFKSGDQSAFETIYHTLNSEMYLIAKKYIKDNEDARDAIQNTFIVINRSINRLREIKFFHTWAFKILRNQCMKIIRQRKSAVYGDCCDYSALDAIADASESSQPGFELERKEKQRILQNLVKSLPPEQFESVILYYYDEKTVSEISCITNCPQGTIKSRLNYARKYIHTKLDNLEKKGMLPAIFATAMADAIRGILEETSSERFAEEIWKTIKFLNPSIPKSKAPDATRRFSGRAAEYGNRIIKIASASKSAIAAVSVSAAIFAAAGAAMATRGAPEPPVLNTAPPPSPSVLAPLPAENIFAEEIFIEDIITHPPSPEIISARHTQEEPQIIYRMADAIKDARIQQAAREIKNDLPAPSKILISNGETASKNLPATGETASKNLPATGETASKNLPAIEETPPEKSEAPLKIFLDKTAKESAATDESPQAGDVKSTASHAVKTINLAAPLAPNNSMIMIPRFAPGKKLPASTEFPEESPPPGKYPEWWCNWPWWWLRPGCSGGGLKK